MTQAIVQELVSRKGHLQETVETIYFGGGTPSLLSKHQIETIQKTIQKEFEVIDSAEITLEANPEDLTLEKATQLFDLGINRLSIGIQTFDEQKLNWMNRIHNSEEAIMAFEYARKVGFKNISLDLIYAIPDYRMEHWQKDLQKITSLDPEHISLYGLTIEKNTVFGKWEQKSRLVQVPEDQAAEQYLFAVEFLKSKGYKQYEVSNFGKEGFHSRHNHAYWEGIPYLGIGPGAHSFDGKSRRFNIRNNAKYLKNLVSNESYFEIETLSEIQRINEQILTSMRTTKGLDFNIIKQKTNQNLQILHEDFLNQVMNDDLATIVNDRFKLRPKGFLVADEIALRLFFPE